MRKRPTTRAAARASLPLSNNVNQRTWRGPDRGDAAAQGGGLI